MATKIKVLVIDTHLDTFDKIKEILDPFEIFTVSYTNSLENKFQQDIVIINFDFWSLDGWDGMEIFKKIRQMTEEVNIIFITDMNEIKKVKGLEHLIFISKPITETNLINSIFDSISQNLPPLM